jgi:hypothetical protein
VVGNVVVDVVVDDVVVEVVDVVVVGSGRQCDTVNRFSLSTQWMPPSQGRFSLPFPVHVWRSVNATCGSTSGVS